MLGETLVYTSGMWEPHGTLEDAQAKKIDTLLARVGADSGKTLLDIGCGFGALLKRGVTEYGIQRAVGTTLSEVQGAYVRENYAHLPIDVRMCDWRDTRGPDLKNLVSRYDCITSVEMIEAVGKQNLCRYFRLVRFLLQKDGVFALQAIVSRLPYGISNAYLDAYIFPDGYLPTEEELVTKASPFFSIHNTQSFGESYIRTLRTWRANLHARRYAFEDPFVRTQEFYLALCEAAFRAGRVDVVQMTLRPH
jgi:cyclopropane-fatty-acyl-phospholipid synthase